MTKKIAIMNNSGNVGKSTLANHLLFPRMENPELFRVETFNEDGSVAGEKIPAEEFDVIMTSFIGATGDVIADIGSSNIELFLDRLTNDYAGAHMFIDYFIIPTTTGTKEQRDTVNTINELLIMGVEAEKIKVIFNKANPKKLIRDQYPTFVETVTGLENDDWQSYPIVNETDLFKTLLRHGINYDDVANDDRDHLALSKKASSTAEKAKLQITLLFKLAYNSYHKNLDEAFSQLFPENKPVTPQKSKKEVSKDE